MQCNLQNSLLTDLKIGKKSGFKKPSTWPDIRKNAKNGHIYLLVDDRYPIGLTATITGGYSVDIDGKHYEDYNSQAQFSMADWSEYTDTEGYSINYPTNAVKAHIIDIYPQNLGNNIIAFSCKRIAPSGAEQQGVLWAHFNLINSISVELSGYYSQNKILEAITSRENILHLSNLNKFVYTCSELTYCPLVECDNNTIAISESFPSCFKIKQVTINNAVITSNASYSFHNCNSLEKISFKNVDTSLITSWERFFSGCSKLKELPKGLKFNSATNMTNFLLNNASLQNTVLDVSAATGLAKIGCYGDSSHFMTGFKGLRVSSSAPFSGTSPQINISYTGMDRNAIVTLFNDLPTVTDGQIINITGCTGSESLSEDDVAIATDKGWTVTK